MSENIDEQEHPIMRIRRELHDKIQELIKLEESMESAFLVGWTLLFEVTAPNDGVPGTVGPSEGLFSYTSDATGQWDAKPWTVRGYLHHALAEFENIFNTVEEDEEDD